MLLGISWWGGLYILLLLLVVYMELSSITHDEEEEEEKTSFFEYTVWISRLVYYASLLVLAILFFQNINNEVLKWCYLGLAIYSIPFGLWFVFDEIKNFIKDPAGKIDDDGEEVEEGEEAGVFFHAIGSCFPLTIFGGGLAFAIIGSLPLI